MKVFLMVVHRFESPGFNLIEVKPKYQGLAKRVHGLSTKKESPDIKAVLRCLDEATKEGSAFRIIPKEFHHKYQVGQVLPTALFGEEVIKVVGDADNVALYVLYYDEIRTQIEEPNGLQTAQVL